MRGIEQFLQVDAATLGALKYAGTWNASTNTPTLASGVGVQGQYYVVSVAGSTNLDGETNWQVGDWAVFNGSVWQKVDGGSTGLLTTLTVTGNTFLATTSGDVGVGTTSPGFKLDVAGSFRTYQSVAAGYSTSIFENTNATGYVQQYLNVGANGASGQASISYAPGIFFAIGPTLNDTTTPIVFRNNNATEHMRITSAGDVGIGTSSPDTKLRVVGTAFFGATGASDTNLRIGALNATDVYLQANSYDGSTAKGFVFYNGGSLNMTLDSSGNLGLGVTPSAWAGYKPLQAGTGASFGGYAGDVLSFVGSNTYNDNTNWRYIVSGNAAARYQQSAGVHAWFTAPSGTAGNAISFTQAMTLDASGNLGVGTTSPASALEILRGAATTAAISLRANAVSTAGELFVGQDGGNAAYVYNRSNQSIAFGTNNTERARITSGGYFKASNNGTYVGSTGSYHELAVDGTGTNWAVIVSNSNATAANCFGERIAYTGAAPNGTGNRFLACEDTGGERASIRSNGGLANYQSNNVDLSDARTKKEITPAPSYWDKIGALEIVTYKYNDQTHDDVNVGVIAQQVESVEPVWVDADGFGETPEDGVPLKTVYTKDITFAAIKALQEAMARIEILESKLQQLGA